MAVPRCSECPAPLVYPEDHKKAGQRKPAGTHTCSTNCRQRRARRMARNKAEGRRKAALPLEVQDMAAAVRGEMKEAAHEAAVEQLRPLVREAMTEEVLRGIDTMIKATPAAIAVLTAQLASEDETIAQRAATLLMKFTFGNPSVAPPPTHVATAPMSVVFNIPRPGDTTPPEGVAQESDEPVELRECADCRQHKSEDEFVGASDRCKECFEGLKHKVTERFGE